MNKIEHAPESKIDDAIREAIKRLAQDDKNKGHPPDPQLDEAMSKLDRPYQGDS